LEISPFFTADESQEDLLLRKISISWYVVLGVKVLGSWEFDRTHMENFVCREPKYEILPEYKLHSPTLTHTSHNQKS
jgi:hypothetical protein